MKHRPEIDGLRAVAVIPVLLFHAGLKSFSGGFVGVDVFFVISGYLITTIILTENENDEFSLVGFYERRARRILPALFFVMIVSFFFAWIWLLPSDMRSFSQSLIAVPTFSSNILFWRQTGYWDIANELKPMLHTWSLAVEEQYYILFPLFLIFIWRFRYRWILRSIMLIAAISFIISQWGAYNAPVANFYLLPTRAWELALGATIAILFLYHNQKIQIFLSQKPIVEVLGLLGIFMIGYAVYAFNDRTPFPSLYALLPTMGTGLIILFSSPKTLVGRLLSAKIFVGIGLISYSAYLWHQPLLSFARHRLFYEPSETICVALVLLSFPLAYLSWRFVEKPFRTKDVFKRKAIFTYSLMGSMVFIMIGLTGQLTNGFEGRFTESQLRDQNINQKTRINYGLSSSCDETFTLSPDCRTDEKPEILVWGDSYAMQLVAGIMESEPDAKIIQMTKSGCGPLFDVAPIRLPTYPLSYAQGCLKFNKEVREWLKENTTVKYAVLSSSFNQYFSSGQKMALNGNVLPENIVLLRNGNILPANIKIAFKEFEKTLKEIQQMGIIPIVFSPLPGNGTNIGRCLSKAEQFGLNLENCDFGVDELSQSRLVTYNFLEKIGENFPVIRLEELICNDSMCVSHLDDIYIYRDKGHFSYEGSAAIGKKHDFFKLITSQK